MDKRQTIILSVTVALVLVLGEQVYQLLHHDVAHKSKAIPVAMASTPRPTEMVTPRSTTPARAPVFQAQLPPSVVANQQHLVTHQEKYIALVNQYELAKMQRQLLEEEVAIASARERIAEINEKTRQLAGPSTTTTPADDLEPAASLTDNTTPHTNSPAPTYQLAYLDHQGETYTATLVTNGRYQEVSAGAQLADGNQITHIDTNGVEMQVNHQPYRLTFNGLMPIKNEEPVLAHAAEEKKPVDLKTETLPVKSESAKPIEPKTDTIQDFNSLTHLEKQLFKPKRSLSLSRPATKINKKQAPKSSASAYTLDEILLLELPPTSYTIELKSATEKHDLVNFAKENALGENAIFYTKSQDNRTWYVLLYSYFNSKSDALAALQKLPEQMLAQHPQIQPLTLVQNWIKKR